ncbi:hypothetical protein ASPZODRAFT_137882 [Penicilliopsis zonata CBS 506.65]|uniref:F-box domain-containing protein n=1 Tax=Penicilliopsis zonata CBS 506.65 TaxID=1073090 RepID=A0A1L9SU54_9EURO|nr:hypothetical protein ASPZODRAFT_137882 [Penicilliopsis zonata CBS 506.65]OJJ50738.1 hypothetical protein ASPZODRAFT_137882 [Penicilliopsis zonata CBS 506.65]
MSLNTLPPELLEQIALFTGTPELFALRLTCRDTQQRTLYTFSARFFSSLGCDLSTSSVARLDAIASHGHLRENVRSICFARRAGVSLGEGFVWERYPWGTIKEEPAIRNTERLRRSLLRFPHCDSFAVYAGYPETSTAKLTTSDVLGVVLDLLNTTQLPVRSFQLVYRSGSIDMRRLPKTRRFSSASMLPNGWSALRTMQLHQLVTVQTLPFLLGMAVHAPQLTSLSLRLAPADLAGEFVYELARVERLAPITELAIEHTACRAEDLRLFLSRLGRSLSSLVLHNVCLLSSDSSISFSTAASVAVPIDLATWATVFHALAQDCPRLQAVAFQELSLSPSARERSPVSFRLDERENKTQCICLQERPPGQVLGVSYTGPEMTRALTMLESAVV